jgi:hypothetical protein
MDFDDGTDATNAIAFAGIPSSLGLLLDEVMIAPGDSGGPVFFGNELIGVASFSACFSDASDCLVPPDVDSELNGSFGELSGHTALFFHSDWISSIVTPVPEPATFAFLSVGLVALGLRARRKTGR